MIALERRSSSADLARQAEVEARSLLAVATRADATGSGLDPSTEPYLVRRSASGTLLAARAVADKAKALAGMLLQMPPGDLEVADGCVRLKSAPDVKKTFSEIAVKAIGTPGFSMAGGLAPGLEHTAYFTPEQSVYSNGTHIAEVEVDVETGGVKILRYTVAHDCGRVINPMVVDGQVVGGVAHGVGNALFERMVYDENAQPLSMNFGEYLLPLASDVPNVDIVHLETPTPLNPLGMKGAGEGGTIPAIGAIISAVENALVPFDVAISEAPLSPQRIIELIAKGRA